MKRILTWLLALAVVAGANARNKVVSIPMQLMFDPSIGQVLTTPDCQKEDFINPITTETMIVRIAEIEVYPQYLEEYLAIANEVDRLSVEREPGVICLFPMQSTEDPTQIRILEIYASDAAYQAHLKTEHFQRYKQGTLHMVKSLKLPTMQPLDPETMQLIFKKK